MSIGTTNHLYHIIVMVGFCEDIEKKLMEHTSHLTDMHIGIARGTAIFGPHDNFDLKT